MQIGLRRHLCEDVQWCERAKVNEKDMSNSISNLPTATGATSNERTENESKEQKEEEVRVMEKTRKIAGWKKPTMFCSRQEQILGENSKEQE